MISASATVSITVSCPPAGPVARDDASVVATPGVAVSTVLANDTYTGAPVLVAVTPVPPELAFNTSTGTVTLLSGAAYGVYTFEYQLCADGGCDTAQVTVTYLAPSVECAGAGRRRYRR